MLQVAAPCNPPSKTGTNKLDFFGGYFWVGVGSPPPPPPFNSSWKAAPQPAQCWEICSFLERIPAQSPFPATGIPDPWLSLLSQNCCSSPSPRSARGRGQVGSLPAWSRPPQVPVPQSTAWGTKAEPKRGQRTKRLCYEVFNINLMPLRKGSDMVTAINLRNISYY